MSTRSAIGLKSGVGNVIYTRCQHDGYLDGVGAELLRSYNSIMKVLGLINGGELNSLAGGDLEYFTDGGFPLTTSLSDFSNTSEGLAWVEYIYLYNKGWYVQSNDMKWIPLKEAIRDPSLLE